MNPTGRIVLVLAAVLFGSVTAHASAILVDFDDDDDPWTIRDVLPIGVLTAEVRFILEVDDSIPSGWFRVQVTDGCCDGPDLDAHYGTRPDYMTFDMDPVFVADWELEIPVCIYCCPWMFSGTFAPDLPVVPGGRYFIGQATWHAYCVSEVCTPPTIVHFDGLEGIGAEGQLTFLCTDPNPSRNGTWGLIKALYR